MKKSNLSVLKSIATLFVIFAMVVALILPAAAFAAGENWSTGSTTEAAGESETTLPPADTAGESEDILPPTDTAGESDNDQLATDTDEEGESDLFATITASLLALQTEGTEGDGNGAAITPSTTEVVTTFAELQTAVGNAGVDTIQVTGPIDITTTLTVTRTLTVEAPSGEQTLLVDSSMGGTPSDPVFSVTAGTFTLKNIIIDGNDCNRGISVDSASLILTDSTVQNCRSGVWGGGFGSELNSGGGIRGINANITLNGDSKVINNICSTGQGNYDVYHMGGGIYMRDTSTLTLNDNALISGNFAGGGGGISMGNMMGDGTANFTFTMNGNSKVVDNSATASAGGIQIGRYNIGVQGSGGTAVLNDNALVANNKANIGGFGGGIVVYGNLNEDTFYGSLTMNDKSCVRDNETIMWGGGIYMRGMVGDLTLNDEASVIGNTSAMNGGGIVAPRGANVYINDKAVVKGNTSGTGGGGIDMSNPEGKLILAGEPLITENTAGTNGGGIYLGATSELHVDGQVRVTDNTAPSGEGGGIYAGDRPKVDSGAATTALYTGLYFASGTESLIFSGNTAQSLTIPATKPAGAVNFLGSPSSISPDFSSVYGYSPAPAWHTNVTSFNNYDINNTDGYTSDYTVSYLAGSNGKFPGSSPSTLTYTVPYSWPIPPAPTAQPDACYVFTGWSTIPDPGALVTADHSYIAQYSYQGIGGGGGTGTGGGGLYSPWTGDGGHVVLLVLGLISLLCVGVGAMRIRRASR